MMGQIVSCTLNTLSGSTTKSKVFMSISLSIVVCYLMKRYRKQSWVSVGELTDIWLYPVKSMNGIRLDKVEVTPKGCVKNGVHDRSYVVVGEDGTMETGRTNSRMMLIQPIVKDDGLQLQTGGMDPLVIPHVIPDASDIKRVKIWASERAGVDMGDAVADWLNGCLQSSFEGDEERKIPKADRTYRLLEYRPNIYRPCDEHNTIDDEHIFSDSVPITIMNEMSVQDLNSRLVNTTPVPPRQFRPNIIIKTSRAFEEDHWEAIKINQVEFSVLAPTTRCIFTTIDPITGFANKMLEPLRTLRKYRQHEDPKQRKEDPSPRLGIGIVTQGSGVVQKGDEVYAKIASRSGWF